MDKQLNIFEQANLSSYKQRYDNFYNGVKERYKKERRAKQKRDSERISIVHGVIKKPKYRKINFK